MPQKIIITVGKLFDYCSHSWRRFTEGALQVVLFIILCLKWSVKKYCVRKILQRTRETFLYEHNRHYNSYKFSYVSFLSFFSLFVETKNKNQVCSKLVIW